MPANIDVENPRVKPVAVPTDKKLFFSQDEIIVSKTDLKGRITYANRTFCRIAGYTEAEVLGQPHSIVRHPDMPRAVFKLLWDTIFGGREIFAYVKNMAKTGDYYWVFAHVTPSYDGNRNIIGFHSNRRVPNRAVIETTITPIYAAILQQEMQQKNGKDAVAAGVDYLMQFLQARTWPMMRSYFQPNASRMTEAACIVMLASLVVAAAAGVCRLCGAAGCGAADLCRRCRLFVVAPEERPNAAACGKAR